jgi:hypothetical protein
MNSLIIVEIVNLNTFVVFLQFYTVSYFMFSYNIHHPGFLTDGLYDGLVFMKMVGSPKYLLSYLLFTKEKDTKGNPMVSHSRCNVRGMSVSVTLDEHKSVVIILSVRVSLNKLSNSTSHKV